MFGHNHEEYLKEKFFEDRSIFAPHGDDYENFCNEINQMKDEESFNKDTSIEDIKYRIAEKSLSFPADIKIGEDKMNIKKQRAMKKAHRLDVYMPTEEVENDLDYDFGDDEFAEDTSVSTENMCDDCDDTSCSSHPDYDSASDFLKEEQEIEEGDCGEALDMLQDSIDALDFIDPSLMSKEKRDDSAVQLKQHISELETIHRGFTLV